MLHKRNIILILLLLIKHSPRAILYPWSRATRERLEQRQRRSGNTLKAKWETVNGKAKQPLPQPGNKKYFYMRVSYQARKRPP